MRGGSGEACGAGHRHGGVGRGVMQGAFARGDGLIHLGHGIQWALGLGLRLGLGLGLGIDLGHGIGKLVHFLAGLMAPDNGLGLGLW